MATRREQADGAYAEMGSAIAEGILLGGLNRSWIREWLVDTGHPSWMLKHWLERYEEEHERDLSALRNQRKKNLARRARAKRAIVDSIAQADPATIPFNRSNLY